MMLMLLTYRIDMFCYFRPFLLSIRGIVCGTDKFRETWINTVIHCLWNWQIVCEADKIELRYYRPNKNSTFFM